MKTRHSKLSSEMSLFKAKSTHLKKGECGQPERGGRLKGLGFCLLRLSRRGQREVGGGGAGLTCGLMMSISGEYPHL